ncbi:MAG: electron transfer flavoprotein subunit beta/FixA family protein [Acidaminococcales bacterium]|jgi:electron transfer flavoprotein beta subunit|nr:electron transfer flavoprotein subunit beta/FixA family protein [Acidaminococcales bacterium]
MKIIVCVKQIPDPEQFVAKINPETKTLIREGFSGVINSFDGYALEMAVRLKESVEGSTVAVLAMSAPNAKSMLQICLSVGADKAFLVTGAAGSDTMGTSLVLSRAIRKIEEEDGPFDAIFCGRQATDGYTGFVGPELAERLNLAQVTFVTDISAQGQLLKAKRENNNGFEIIETAMPALFTVTKTDYEPRFPTVRSRLASLKAPIHNMDLAGLGIDADLVGLKGAKVEVTNVSEPEQKRAGIIITVEDPGAAAAQLGKILNEKNLI